MPAGPRLNVVPFKADTTGEGHTVCCTCIDMLDSRLETVLES